MRQTVKKSSWFLRILGEFVVIVVGVVVAFQFENWRIATTERNREQEHLVALQLDFSENVSRFARVIEQQQEVVDRSVALLSIMERRTRVSSDSISLLISSAMSWFRVEPMTGAYDALVGAADVDLISNPNLRRRLAVITTSFKAGLEDHQNAMDLLSLLQFEVSPYYTDLALWGSEIGLGRNDPVSASQGLLANERVRGLLFQNTLLEQFRLNRQRRLAAQVDTVLTQILEELR
jgi:hypothetical protein